MDKYFNKLWEHAKRGQEVSIEIRIFRMITLAVSVLCIFVILPTNLLQDLPVSLNVILTLYGLLTFFFYLNSTRGRHSIKLFHAATILLLNAGWFLNAGSNGSISYYFFATVIYCFIFFRRFFRAAMFTFLLLNNTILLLVERYYPSMVIPFKSPNDRLFDMISGFCFSAFTCALVFWVVVTTLEQELKERKAAEVSLQKLNDELDLRVQKRTFQLEKALREQESFSYSVSHDLRAPLRHINSYLAIMTEDFGELLPGEAHELLGRTQAASVRMGKLIDDLLELSRVSRTSLVKTAVNLSELATHACDWLYETEPERRVEVVIAGGLSARGDNPLLMQAMVNLLGNAWKYSSRNPAARIEFGKRQHAGQDIFFVKDNGVGFDMAYSDKLFGAFQRLHGSEYEGNGIGLATVKRIIERHGGEVWAESKVNEGATFYFSL